MLKATLKSLLAHKLRLALTALAVVLGVAFVSGTFVLTDTIKHTFNNLFQQTSVGKDAVVRGVAPYGNGLGGGGGDNRGNGTRPLTPEGLIDTIRGVPGVAAADGEVQGFVTVLNKQGKTFTHMAPTIATTWFPDRQLSALHVVTGRGPLTGDEVTIDLGTAKKEHFAVGDRITVIGEQVPTRYTIVGITKFGSSDNLAGATIVTFPLATVQQLVGKPGYVNEIDVAATTGTNSEQLLGAIGSKLPKGFEVITGAQAASEQASNVSQGLSQFNTILLVFAGIALFVGAFLIFNTFSILVGQRTRELALLRAVGASKSQLNRSVLGEAAITGFVGSAIGVGLGILLASGIYALLNAIGVSLPRSTLQVQPRTVIVGLVVGTLVTLAAAVLPALRAGAIPPAAGLRDDVILEDTSLRRRAITGGTASTIGVFVLAIGLFANAGILAVGLGAAVTFLGVAMLAPFVAGPMARALGRPLPAVAGISGRLSQENAARNPRRTAATASALMVGVALVAAIATLAQSATASFNGLFDRAIKATYVVTASGFGTLSPAVEEAVRQVPGVVAVNPVRSARWHLGSVGKDVSGIDPVAGPQVLNIKMVTGTFASVGDNKLLIDNTIAKHDHFRVGQVIPMGFATTGIQNVVVGGTFETNQFLGNYVVSNAFLSANVLQTQDQLIALRTTAVTPATTAALTAAVKSYGNAEVKTAAKFKSDQKKQLGTILTIVYALLGLSIVIALVGVVNTLALSVMERTREIGLLRAVGMQRRQVKRMIRGEAVVVSLIGAVIGLVLGLGLGAAVVSALSSTFITTLAIPYRTVIVILVLAALFGVGAAMWPARRAAKLDVLRAIYTV